MQMYIHSLSANGTVAHDPIESESESESESDPGQGFAFKDGTSEP